MSDQAAEAAGVVFAPLPAGREAVMLGKVRVGEIMRHVASPRHSHCYRLMLPDSEATGWRPARDIEVARWQCRRLVNDWLNAADVRPNIEQELRNA